MTDFIPTAFGVRTIDIEDILFQLRAGHGVRDHRVVTDEEYKSDPRFAEYASDLLHNVEMARARGAEDAVVLVVDLGWSDEDDWFDAELINELGRFPIYFCHPREV